MPELQKFAVDARTRLDQFVLQLWPPLDRRAVRQMIRGGAITVNGRAALKAGQYLEPGDQVTVAVSEIAEPEAVPAVFHLPLSVVYEDEVLVAVDKPAAVAVWSSRKTSQGALAQQLAEAYPNILHVGGAERAGIIMRIEPEVSGLILAAKDESTYRAMQRMVKHRQVETVYSVLVEGRLTGAHRIDEPLGNMQRARERLAVAREGRPARTFCRGQRHYKEGGRDYSLLEVRPETSRLHQIRVHLAWYGFPIVGDRLYGSRNQPILPDRIFLHLGVLTFLHPVTGEPVRVESALPPELFSVLRYLARPKTV
jgi:23S rRNA pseudouridine1911/1915/1917 synthase